MEADARYAQQAAQAQQAIRDRLAQFPPHLDLAEVAPYQGVYTNPELGEVTLALKDAKFVLEAGIFAPELRSTGNRRLSSLGFAARRPAGKAHPGRGGSAYLAAHLGRTRPAGNVHIRPSAAHGRRAGRGHRLD